MLEYIKLEPPMEIRVARDNVLHSTTQGILLVVVRGTDDVLRKVKLLIVLVPGLKRNSILQFGRSSKRCQNSH